MIKKNSVFLVILVLISVFACSCKNKDVGNDLSLSRTELTLKVGESEKLVLKKDGIIVVDGVTWISSDETIVSVDNGTVIAKATGKASVRAGYGRFEVSCAVNVNAASQTGLSVEELYLSAGDEENIYFKVNGENVIDGIVWSSSDLTVATVENGKVTCLEKGVASITATYESKEYFCRVEVNASPVGAYVATVTVDEMDGAEFTFDLTLNADKTYEYSRRDSGVDGEDGFIAGSCC